LGGLAPGGILQVGLQPADQDIERVEQLQLGRDGAADVLQGATGADWYFANLSGGVALDVLDARAGWGSWTNWASRGRDGRGGELAREVTVVGNRAAAGWTPDHPAAGPRPFLGRRGLRRPLAAIHPQAGIAGGVSAVPTGVALACRGPPLAPP
jgi:hypothetical protein